MEKKVISTWVPDSVVKKIDERVREGEFINTSDFLRQLVRKALEEDEER